MKDEIDKVRKSLELKEEHFELYVKKFFNLVGISYTEENKDILKSLIINGVILHELNIKECSLMLEKGFEQVIGKENMKKFMVGKELELK